MNLFPEVATQAEAEAGSDNTKLMTPLRTAQAIAALAPSGGAAGGRIMLSADADYYVSNSGNDTNAGTISAPWETLQHAWDWIRDNLDFASKRVKVHVANGSYAPFYAVGPNVGKHGGGYLQLLGNNATPGNCVIQANDQSAVYAGGSSFFMDGFRFVAYGNANNHPRGIVADMAVVDLGAVEFGTCVFAHMHACGTGSRITPTASYSILDGAQVHALAELHGEIIIQGRSINLSAPGMNFSNAFCLVGQIGLCDWTGSSFAGYATTGKTYVVGSNGVLVLAGVPNNGLPGNAAGTTSGGGQVIT